MTKERSADWLRLGNVVLMARNDLRTPVSQDLTKLRAIVHDRPEAVAILDRVDVLITENVDRLRSALKHG